MNGSKFLNNTEEIKEFSWSSSSIKFYISMLSISLIIGLLYFSFLIYKYRSQKTKLILYITNIIIVLIFRTFFSLLIAAIIYLNKNTNLDGIKTLFSFECIFLNLVLAFWCILGIYIHSKVCSTEMDMTLWLYGLPSVAVFFALVWIFVMTSKDFIEIFLFFSQQQWIVQSIRLLYLLIQLGLVIDMGRLLMIKKNSLDNDCKSLLIKNLIVIVGLLLVFWLQFGFSTGFNTYLVSNPFLNFWFFIDGSQLALLCPLFYLLEKWENLYLYGDNFILTTMKKSDTKTSSRLNIYDHFFHENLNSGEPKSQISTIQSVYAELENAKSKSNDVVYSSVVSLEKLQKTVNLYNRFNVFLEDKATVFQNENFYECIDEDNTESRKNSQQYLSVVDVSRDKEIDSSCNGQTSYLKETKNLQNDKFNNIKNKNAFYKSKYLVVDEEQNKASENYMIKAQETILENGVITKKKKINENQKKKLMKVREEKLMKANTEILSQKNLSLESLDDLRTDKSLCRNEINRKKQERAGVGMLINEQTDFNKERSTNNGTKENSQTRYLENNFQDNNYDNKTNIKEAEIDDVLQTTTSLKEVEPTDTFVRDDEWETKMIKHEENSKKDIHITPENLTTNESNVVLNFGTEKYLNEFEDKQENRPHEEKIIKNISENEKILFTTSELKYKELKEQNYGLPQEIKSSSSDKSNNVTHIPNEIRKLESSGFLPTNEMNSNEKIHRHTNLNENVLEQNKEMQPDNTTEEVEKYPHFITHNQLKMKKPTISDVNSFSEESAKFKTKQYQQRKFSSSSSEFEIEKSSTRKKIGKNENKITETTSKPEKTSSFSSASEFEIEFFKRNTLNQSK